MKTWIVTTTYRRQRLYIVQADTEEQARVLAADAIKRGNWYDDEGTTDQERITTVHEEGED